jgi:hypothetical protein
MRFHTLSTKDFWKSAGIGVLTALLLSAVMVPAFKLGVSPLPKPLGLAFAEALLGKTLLLPVGLLFHVAYVTFFSVVYVALFRDALTFKRALGLAAALWVLVLVVFFPFVGWGFFGLSVSPKLIPASAVPHVLFAVILWGLSRLVYHHHTHHEPAGLAH